jgi:FtsH-binding integral membrane protein
MILLGIFTMCQSYFVSYICGVTAVSAGTNIVVMAAVMTIAIVLACTIYAFKTETDFTTSWGLVIVISVAMMVLFIFTLFTSSPFIHKIYCTLGVILFGIYLIIDTQSIMGGKSY